MSDLALSSSRNPLPPNTRQDTDINDVLSLGRVLLLGSRSETVVGRPYVPGASVLVAVEEHFKDGKVRAAKVQLGYMTSRAATEEGIRGGSGTAWVLVAVEEQLERRCVTFVPCCSHDWAYTRTNAGLALGMGTGSQPIINAVDVCHVVQVHVFKKTARKRYRKYRGARPQLTTLSVLEVGQAKRQRSSYFGLAPRCH
jgi:ribosomal protein L21